MTRKVKRLVCGALAALMLFGGALAEEGGADAEAQAAIEAQQRAEQEAREQAEREARERAEREAREQAEREARERAEREAREQAEREAKEKAEREAKEKAEREAKEKAERDAKEKAEREAKEKAAQEAASKQEQETKAEKPKEDKPEEKPAVTEEKPEEKPAVKEEKPEEKPAAKEEKPEEKPAVTEDKQEEIPVIKADKTEEAPEEKPAEVSTDTLERAPEPILEEQPEAAPAEEAEDEIASDAAEEASEESAEESPELSEDDVTDAPAEASEEEIPAAIEENVESAEAFAAEESAQSRADAQAAPPAGDGAAPGQIALPETLASEVAAAPADIALAPEASKGVTGKDGVYQIQTMPGKDAAKATLSFPLNYAGACTGYKVSVVDAQGNVVYSVAQTEPAVVLDLSTYKTGSYVLVVEAVSGEAVVAWGQYAFSLASGSGFPGGFPGGFGGGFPGRGGSGGAPDGAAEGEDPGFQVTPGEALAGSHTAGTKDLQLYGAVALTLPDGAMTELILGDTSLGIVLDGGSGSFTATIDGGRLTLTADGGGTWSFNGRALRILSDSGIETLVLKNRDGARVIATAQPLAGDLYARLCAAGVASSDCDYRVTAAGTRVTVDGRAYRVDDSGAMTPMEDDDYAETMGDAAAGAD